MAAIDVHDRISLRMRSDACPQRWSNAKMRRRRAGTRARAGDCWG
jgi:hypothetical protein